jgi:hypothetical protein
VIAPESANNSKEGGALLPTLAFGIPGSATMAILLGAFAIHGLVPGPDLLTDNAPLLITMILTIAVANLLATVFPENRGHPADRRRRLSPSDSSRPAAGGLARATRERPTRRVTRVSVAGAAARGTGRL